MPQRRSGIKELRKTHRRSMQNLDIKTDIKKTVKSFMKAVDENKTDEIKSQLPLVYKKMDKAAKRGLIKKNTASRRKARFAKIASKATSS